MNILEDTNFSMLNNFTQSPEYKYTEYLNTHISNVKKGYEYLKENLPYLFDNLEISIDEMDEQISNHDKSKWGPEEFEAYTRYFYGDGKNEEEFNEAWKHHYLNNPHHPEYWNKTDMPKSCILEMICDWWSFGWKDGNLFEIFDFFEKGDKRPLISENTLTSVEEILNILKESLKGFSAVSVENLKEQIENYKIDSFSSPEELLKWMRNNIKYNLKDNKVRTPDEVLNDKIATCYDQTIFQKKYFSKMHIPFETYFIYATDNNGKYIDGERSNSCFISIF